MSNAVTGIAVTQTMTAMMMTMTMMAPMMMTVTHDGQIMIA